eukprot:scaffold151289_cov30-Tisochrysis_lutea.AAC.2
MCGRLAALVASARVLSQCGVRGVHGHASQFVDCMCKCSHAHIKGSVNMCMWHKDWYMTLTHVRTARLTRQGNGTRGRSIQACTSSKR